MCKDLLSSVVETDFFELIKGNFWATFSWNEQLLGNFCKFLGQLLRDIRATCVKAYKLSQFASKFLRQNSVLDLTHFVIDL